eukprot:361423-Chlamydomonas_euryale.AAC.2
MLLVPSALLHARAEALCVASLSRAGTHTALVPLPLHMHADALPVPPPPSAHAWKPRMLLQAHGRVACFAASPSPRPCTEYARSVTAPLLRTVELARRLSR